MRTKMVLDSLSRLGLGAQLRMTSPSCYKEPQRGGRRVLLSTFNNTSVMDWYARDVCNLNSYIDGALRLSRKNEAYLFMRNGYVQVRYTPGTTENVLLNGPSLIRDGFPSLYGTVFASYGIDCAFGSNINGVEVFISWGNLCALLEHEPGTTNYKITKGPTSIAEMFPFFRGTEFESGVDAAFDSTRPYEAYLFQGDNYARINYSSNSHLITLQPIIEGFPCLKDTIFESGIDAAFAPHRENEAYLFKGEFFTCMHFTPGTTDGYLIGGVNEILPFWPSLRNVLPRKNCGVVRDFEFIGDEDDPNHDHDEV